LNGIVRYYYWIFIYIIPASHQLCVLHYDHQLYVS
jgi:hypothetical protein